MQKRLTQFPKLSTLPELPQLQLQEIFGDLAGGGSTGCPGDFELAERVDVHCMWHGNRAAESKFSQTM